MRNVSIFAPKNFINLSPKFLKMHSMNVGFKKKDNDLLIVIFENSINVECIYSKTSTPSAPIIWDKKNNKGKCKVLIVNAGNANAHTGNNGIKVIDKYVGYLSSLLKCKKNEILVSSTGVIGEVFDPNIIIKSFKNILKSKKIDLIKAASSIMTTDTFPKTASHSVKIDNNIIRIYGFAKGSGMIFPNMGTMLAYIFIECSLSNIELKKLIKDNIDNTFNSISVDGDTSTSDTLMLFSLSKLKINLKKNNYTILSNAIQKVMKNLSMQVIKDGEGLSKLIEVSVTNAKNPTQGKNIAFTIVNSPLVKTAIAGEDANWGRIIMAIGKSYEKITQNKIKIYFGNNLVCEKGSITNKINIPKLNKYMKEKIIKIKVDLGLGKYSKTVYGNDLTYKYIKINADYRS